MDLSGTDNQNQPMSDDQELAKALAGVTEEANSIESVNNGGIIQPPAPIQPDPAAITPQSAPEPVVAAEMPIAADPIVAPTTQDDSGLSEVKQAALLELRPLIDKLDVEPDEKFNTYLLLIRSTDDKDLIAPAHEAAKGIVDEAKRAQALLDIIKEIDFLSKPKQ